MNLFTLFFLLHMQAYFWILCDNAKKHLMTEGLDAFNQGDLDPRFSAAATLLQQLKGAQ